MNQVAWAPVAMSYFQGRTRGIPGSNPRGNNVWPVRMPLHTSRISRISLVGRKPVWKPKKSSKPMSTPKYQPLVFMIDTNSFWNWKLHNALQSIMQ